VLQVLIEKLDTLAVTGTVFGWGGMAGKTRTRKGFNLGFDKVIH